MINIKNIQQIEKLKWKRVLVFMPHPDDEAVFCSGLISELVSQNIQVRAITLTRAEKSTLRYGLSPTEDLAQARTKELERSYQCLGVKDFKILDFPDGKLEKLETEVFKKLAKEIEDFKPTEIVTLEPDGIYGHPDHVSLSKVVTSLKPSGCSLIYATVRPNYIFPKARKMAKKSVIKPINPDYKLKLSITDVLSKIRSLRTHKTQFRISLFNFEVLLFFTVNDMLVSEYFAIRS